MMNDENIDTVVNNQNPINMLDSNSMLCDLTSDSTESLNISALEKMGTLPEEMGFNIIEQDMTKPYRIIFKGEFVHD